jgi:RNA polymerase sigma-70 factor (ECF subfamily)
MACTSTHMQSTRLEFQRLLVENERRIFGYILTLVPSSDDAQEIFQNVCVVIFSKADQFVAGSDFAKWACQIAHYEVFSYRRRRQKQGAWLSSEVLDSLAAKRLEAAGELEARYAALRSCLEKLRPNDRKLVETRYRRDIPARDLAVELGRPIDTVYKALRRIRRSLHACIERTMAREESTRHDP